MLFLRFQFDDSPDNRVDLTTGDEGSMLELIEAVKKCDGILTIDSYGVTYTIDMEKVASWEVVTRGWDDQF